MLSAHSCNSASKLKRGMSALWSSTAAGSVCALCHPTLGIRREWDRLVVQYDLRLASVTGKFITPAQAKALPRITGELWAESETRFFARTTGMPITFSQDDQGKMNPCNSRFSRHHILSPENLQ